LKKRRDFFYLICLRHTSRRFFERNETTTDRFFRNPNLWMKFRGCIYLFRQGTLKRFFLLLDEYHDLSSKAAYFFTQDLMKYAFHLSFTLVVGVTHGAAAALSDLPLLAAALALSLSFLLFFLLKLLFKITHKSKIKDSRTEKSSSLQRILYSILGATSLKFFEPRT